MAYAKAHPFGYRPLEAKGRIPTTGRQVTHIQRVVINKRPMLDINGKEIYTGKGKNRQKVYEYFPPYIRTIYHYDKQYKGKTFAEMVYESFRV